MATTICNVDRNLVFTGDKQTLPNDRLVVPRGWVATEPPKGDGVWQWRSTRWAKLSVYPQEPPPAPEAAQKSKEEYVADLEARKECDALVALIDERIAAAASVVKGV